MHERAEQFRKNAELRPMGAVHCVEAYASVADVDLKSVAVVLQFVRPARSAWWLVGDTRQTGMHETGRGI